MVRNSLKFSSLAFLDVPKLTLRIFVSLFLNDITQNSPLCVCGGGGGRNMNDHSLSFSNNINNCYAVKKIYYNNNNFSP